MDAYLEKSLRLMKNWLDTVSDDDLYEEYFGLAKNEGQKIDHLLESLHYWSGSESNLAEWVNIEIACLKKSACNDALFSTNDGERE